MFKLSICFIIGLFFLLFCGGPVYCQTDSSVTDTAQVETGIADTSYLPISGNLTIPADLRQVPDSIIKAYQRDPNFAYANDPAYWKELPPPEPDLFDKLIDFLYTKLARTCIFIIFLLLIVYGIYRLARENSFNWFSRKIRKNRKGGEVSELEEQAPMDLDEAIRRSGEEGNFSLAIRYMYLKTIRKIFEKKDILVRTTSTNAEMAAAFQDPQLAKEFRWLATAYEYVFYGGFVPGPEQFGHLQRKFNAFNQILGN